MKQFPEEALPDLIRLVHGNNNNKMFLAKEFLAFWSKKTEEEMAKEYGEGQPFVDPGSLAYEAFDYDGQGQGDNGSNDEEPQSQRPVMGYPVQYPGQMGMGGMGGYAQPPYPQVPLPPQGYPQIMPARIIFIFNFKCAILIEYLLLIGPFM